MSFAVVKELELQLWIEQIFTGSQLYGIGAECFAHALDIIYFSIGMNPLVQKKDWLYYQAIAGGC